MELDSLTKIAQIIFYSGGLLLGALTYRRAKSTILNTVNTEYHKKVIEHLAELSESLYLEFDFSSAALWYRQNDFVQVVDKLHEEIADRKDEIIAKGQVDAGIMASPKMIQISTLSKKYKSDPFLPDPIRNKLVSLFEKRDKAMSQAYLSVMLEYMSELAKGRHWDTLDTNKHWLQEKVEERLEKGGAGFKDVNEAVNEIRLEIHRYFKQFSPAT